MSATPNFFLAGAPKSGTTALAEYLRTHPNIFVTDPKEPSFFSNDIQPPRYGSLGHYLALFDRATSQHLIVADASTSYIHSAVALQRIHSLWPTVKIAVMLRCPVDLVYAFHGEMLRVGIETESNFQKAWHLQAERAEAHYPTHQIAARHKLQYQWIGSLGTQIEKLLALFPRTQVHLITFDDFCSDPNAAYESLLRFLCVERDTRVDFPPANQARAFKSLWLNQTMWRTRRYLRTPTVALFRRLGIKGTGLLTLVERLNSSHRPRPSLDPIFRRELSVAFAPEVRKLEHLLHRDLEHWLQ
jgi:hypothetical protein